MAQPISRQAGKRFERSERSSPRPLHRSLTESTPVLFRLPTIAPSDLLTGAIALDRTAPANWSGESDAGRPSSTPAAKPMLSASAVPAEQSVSNSLTQAIEKPAPQTNIYLVKRSWWEHWSSGIVLIILVIALVTASIIAFSDSAASDPELLAGQKNDASSDFDMLPDLTIPDVDLSAAKVAKAGELESRGASTSGDSLAAKEPKDTANDSAQGLVPDDLTLMVDSPSRPQATLQAPETLATAPASASLETPVGMTPPALQLDESLVSSNSPTVQEPSASLPVAAPSASTGGLTPEQLPLPILDTNQPSYAAILASNSGQVRSQLATTEIGSSNLGASAANRTPASSSADPTAPLAEATPVQQVRPTLTPDSDAELYIQAYREMSSIHQAETSSFNRYPSTTKP